ncbi:MULTISPECIES: hypothetical protein [Streptomyces]|uniref:DNA-binding phage zinc finger domain-containing protein n=2 Tax=Streptomyces TaxID=1883 RepID=A0ABV9J6M8_9ACTN
MTKQPPDRSPRTVDCPPPPDGCAATAGEPCLSHGGTRVRHSFHQARTAAWEAARIAAVPAANLIFDAKARRGMHGKDAAELLDKNGYSVEAEQLRRAVSEAHGHMSARQAIAFLVDHAEGGEGQ